MRKNLRRKFRAADEAVPPVVMEVREDVRDCVDELLPLYHQVLGRSAFRFEELTREYFIGLSETMPDRARFFIWRQGGRQSGGLLARAWSTTGRSTTIIWGWITM